MTNEEFEKRLKGPCALPDHAERWSSVGDALDSLPPEVQQRFRNMFVGVEQASEQEIAAQEAQSKAGVRALEHRRTGGIDGPAALIRMQISPIDVDSLVEEFGAPAVAAEAIRVYNAIAAGDAIRSPFAVLRKRLRKVA